MVRCWTHHQVFFMLIPYGLIWVLKYRQIRFEFAEIGVRIKPWFLIRPDYPPLLVWPLGFWTNREYPSTGIFIARKKPEVGWGFQPLGARARRGVGRYSHKVRIYRCVPRRVLGTVYTDAVSMPLHLSVTRRRFEFVIQIRSFWKRFQTWSVFKTIRFHWSCERWNRIDLKTVWREIGWLAKCRVRCGFQVMKPFRLETASV